MFFGRRVIERRGQTHDQRARYVIIHTPTRIQFRPTEFAFRREKPAVVQHTDDFPAKEKSDDDHKIGEIRLIHFLEIYREIEIEVRERHCEYFRQTEERGLDPVQGGEQPAEHERKPERDESPGQFGESSAFLVRDEIEYEPTDNEYRDDGYDDPKTVPRRFFQKYGSMARR